MTCISEKSVANGKMNICPGQGAITLLSKSDGTSIGCLHRFFSLHTMLLIEFFDSNNHHIYGRSVNECPKIKRILCHLVQDNSGSKSVCLAQELIERKEVLDTEQVRNIKSKINDGIYSKTSTWLKSNQDIYRLLESITNGEKINFSIQGRYAVLNKFWPWSKANQADNCCSWAIRKLKMVDIDLGNPENFWGITWPPSYVNSAAMPTGDREDNALDSLLGNGVFNV